MKVKHNKQVTQKRTKLKVGRSKIILTTQKVKKHFLTKKQNMFTQKDKPSDEADYINDMQDISLPNKSEHFLIEKAATQSSLRHKKKERSKTRKIKKQSSSLQYVTSNSSEWDNSEQYLQEKIDKNWMEIKSKKERNIGLPVVVEVHSEISSPNVSQIFEQQESTKTNETIFQSDSCVLDTILSDNEEACDTIDENVNLKVTNEDQAKYEKQILHWKTQEDNENNSLTNINISTVNSPDSSAINAESIENSTMLIDCSSHTERQDSAFKNVNAGRRSHSRTEPKVFCIKNQVIVVMGNESRFCFTGKLTVNVLYGAVQIYGTTLNTSNGATQVYSPRGYSNVTIETSKAFLECSIDDIWVALSAEGITRDSESVLENHLSKIQPGMVVLVLQNFENKLTLFLKAYCPFKLFPEIQPRYYSWTDSKRAEIILQSNLYFERHDDFIYKRLITDPGITTDIAERMLNNWRANEWSCTLIAGGKSVGKSTSVRCLINSLLCTSKQVVLIDVDPGQAECTPAGCISCTIIDEPLMGPNFTHLKTPAYQLYIDDVNVTRCITRYLEAVKMLVQRLKQCPILSRLPIVVNTMGFTQNLGWDIAIFTIKLIKPSIILQIMSTKKKNNYNNYFSAEVVNKEECLWAFCNETFIDWNEPCKHDLCIIHSQAETKKQMNEWKMQPYQQRELAMISYFSGTVRDNDDYFPYNAGTSSLSINEATPYSAPFFSLCIIPSRLFGVPASHALNVINANIVALCGINLNQEASQESQVISSLQILTQRAPLCTCYGFGIIKGVDMERQEIFIVTPLPISMMQHINCLAGCIPIPPSMLQLKHGAPYVQSGNAVVPTSRDTRRGYFRMRYQKTANTP